MAVAYDDIRAALEVKLSTLSELPTVSWENAHSEPKLPDEYLKPRFLPTRREPAVRGLSPQMYYQGIFLVECYTQEGKGPGAADALANKIIEAFDATTDLEFRDTYVSIRYAERELGEVDGSYYMVPVNIGWYCYK